MNLVFFSPHFPPQYHLFCAAAKKRGINVLGLGDCPWESLPGESRDALNDYAYVPNMDSDDAVIRALGLLTHRHGKIDRIDSLNEHWLDMEARMREHFNVFGQRPADTARNRSKTAMREVFESARVPCTQGVKFDTADEARTFAAKHGYPCVLKPDTGVGASGAFRVDSDADLSAALARNLTGYVIEAFTLGTLGSYDGLTDREGRIVFETSHVYSAGIMDIVNDGVPMYYYSRREIPAMLLEYGRRAVAAFGVRERFFHVEFFALPDGDFCGLEINVRPPGGYTTDMMNYSMDGDIYDLWARVVSEGTADFVYERKHHVMHISRRNDRTYKLTHEAALARLSGLLVHYRPMPAAFAGAMGDHMYLVRGDDLDVLIEAATALQEYP